MTRSVKGSAPFFRTTVQWQGFYARYACAALATVQNTILTLLGHPSTVARVAEEERGSHSTPAALAWQGRRRALQATHGGEHVL